jgi:hypothetical protein
MSKKPKAELASGEPLVPAGPLSHESLLKLRERLGQEEQMFANQLAQSQEGLARTRGGMVLVDRLIEATKPGAGKEPV